MNINECVGVDCSGNGQCINVTHVKYVVAYPFDAQVVVNLQPSATGCIQAGSGL